MIKGHRERLYGKLFYEQRGKIPIKANSFWSNNVRMAERSKAPDSRVRLLAFKCELSGPRMWAWVRIPLLTKHFICLDIVMLFKLNFVLNVEYLFCNWFVMSKKKYWLKKVQKRTKRNVQYCQFTYLLGLFYVGNSCNFKHFKA